jgi:hypothetical protein
MSWTDSGTSAAPYCAGPSGLAPQGTGRRSRSRRGGTRALGLCVIIAMTACASVLGFDGLEQRGAVPSKSQFALTSGGTVSRSPRYRLVSALGESPGGNVVGKSTSFTLFGGVVAAKR